MKFVLLGFAWINSNMKIKEILLQSMLTHLLQLCKQELNLADFPNITFVDDPVLGSGTSFGEFDGDIRVATKDRHPIDIARTLAHEIIHWKQSTLGLDLDGTTGSTTENDANAIAGVILRKFGKLYPEYFLQILPAD